MIIVKIHAGLGNQLFQYAFAKNLEIITGKKVLLDLSFYNQKDRKSMFRLNYFSTDYEIANDHNINKLQPFFIEKKIFSLCKRLKIVKKEFTGFKYFTQQSNCNLNYKRFIKKEIYFNGYWAGENYFSDYKDEIVKSLRLKKKVMAEVDPDIINKIQKLNTVSIHIRRGDYLNNPYFHNLSISYYKNAICYINKIIKSPEYIVFSNDIDWVKKNLQIHHNVIFMDKGNPDYMDLYYMSRCQHNIIANSTFSWWGAYLNNNENKIVIAPQIWFDNNDAQKFYETKSRLIPENWIKM